MCKHGTEIVAPLPDDIHTEKEVRSVSLDSCIADTILALWDAKIQTRGCCCGHGKGYPDVVIAEHEDANRVAEIIKSVDPRPWKILQWQLVEAATTELNVGAGAQSAMIENLASPVHSEEPNI